MIDNKHLYYMNNRKWNNEKRSILWGIKQIFQCINKKQTKHVVFLSSSNKHH